MKTFKEFYQLMEVLKDLRVKAVSEYFNQNKLSYSEIETFKAVLSKLESIPKVENSFVLRTDNAEPIEIELDYEINELIKDQLFLQKGFKDLEEHFETQNSSYKTEISAGLHFLNSVEFDYLFTDRDGTISNYCGRYLSSVQGVGNAIMLSELSKMIKEQSVILTAAPLLKGGIQDVLVQPQGQFVIAGSKGREFFDSKGVYHSLPIEKEQQRVLDDLYNQLVELLDKNEYSIFRYIGSGLQQKFGEIGLARQDKNLSVSSQKSLDFKNEVLNCVMNVDPKGDFLVLDDTGKDLEINLSFGNSQNAKEFNKGDGLDFIVKSLHLDLKRKKVLICGDTFSDVSILSKAQELDAEVFSIFVTKDKALKKKVKSVCSNSFFVATPDTLVALLYKYAIL